MTMNTYEADLSDLTVYRISNGFRFDMNEGGEECTSIPELTAFISELHEQDAYDADIRDQLLADVA